MKVLVVSGFLGAGKTTFIKELIRRTKQDLVVMENEYGQTDLDSKDLSASGDVDVWEMMEGCVCCTMKDSFAASVVTISSALAPDYLVVEPTGAAQLSRVMENLSQISYEQIQILPPVVVVPPVSLAAHSRDFPEIFPDQISAAGTVVFSKAEGADPDFLADARRRVESINPRAAVVATPYRDQPEEWWFSLLGRGVPDSPARITRRISLDEIREQLMEHRRQGGEEVPEEAQHSTAEHHHHHEHGHEHHHHGACGHEDHPEGCTCGCHEEAEADGLEECSLHSGSLDDPVRLICFLEDALRGRFGLIARAKGVIPAGDQILRFDLADGLYAVTGGADFPGEPQCVFIGRDLDREAIIQQMMLHWAGADPIVEN